MGLCITVTPATWVDPWGLFTSLEDYKYQLEKKLADPLTSVYLEPGLREAALGYIYDSMNSNGRNGVLDLSIISLKDTPESRAIIGAIRKLSGLHGEPIYGDNYFERMMDAVASAYKYSPPAWHIFDTAMFGYFTQLSCGVQQLVDSKGWTFEKFNEKNIANFAFMAAEVNKAVYLMLGYVSSLPKDNVYQGVDSKGLTSFGNKSEGYLAKRGWTWDSAQNIVKNPYTTRLASNKATNNPATAFYNKAGDYVVVDNVTGELVQSSKFGDVNWIPDNSIVNPYKP